VFYEIMEKAWPDAAADSSLPPVVHEYGQIWVSKPKVLVSRSRGSAGYNTRVVGGENAIGQLAQIRSEVDGPVAVGGSSLATQLLAAGLLDELVLYTHPSVLGFGRSLFHDYDRPVDLELMEQKRFVSGVTCHRYTILPTV
jgi:dihydrofolate reductase